MSLVTSNHWLLVGNWWMDTMGSKRKGTLKNMHIINWEYKRCGIDWISLNKVTWCIQCGFFFSIQWPRSTCWPLLSLFLELSFPRIGESITGYTFTPCVGSFTSPSIDTRQKGPPAFSVSSERHRHVWGYEIAQFRNGGRWDWTTVPSIDSPVLYRATSAPHFIYLYTFPSRRPILGIW